MTSFDAIHDPAAIQDLLTRKPYLAYYFADPPDGDPFLGLRLLEAKNGRPVPVLDGEGSAPRWLSSRYDPDREAARNTGFERDWAGTELIILLGLGNPALVEMTLNRLGENQVCMAVDANAGLGRLLARRLPDFLTYLDRPGCHLFCGDEMAEALWTYLEALPMERTSGVRVIAHEASLKLAPEFYAMVEERIRKNVSARMSDLLTRFEFEKNWMRNIIINSNRLPAQGDAARADTDAGKREGDSSPRIVASYEGALRGKPGLLVAAGPSLRADLPLVRKLRERAFVLCCDTACKVLSNSGIRPHGAVTLDAQKHTVFHFLGDAIRDSVLFADLVTHPMVLRNVQPAGTIFSTTAKYVTRADGSLERLATPGTEHAERIAGPMGDIQSGGSVATTGFELLRFLGADPIILIGQDLAYTGREIHSTGTHHNERWLTMISRSESLERINEAVIRKRQTHEVPAHDGGTVLTDYVLELYRHWFEDAIPRCGVRVINLTGRGAKIAGAERPENIPAFVDSLPRLDDPAAPFAASLGPSDSFHDHELNRRLLARIRELADLTRDELPGALEKLLEDFPYLETITRHTDIYVRRNRAKLSDERAEKLLFENKLRDLARLARALRPYVAVNGRRV